MPPKNNISFGPGTLFFNTPEGLRPLGGIQELTLTEETEPDILGETAPKIIVPQRAEFTVEATSSTEAMLRLWYEAKLACIRDNWRTMCALYPRRRIVHLAERHRDPLTRKKNVKRICTFYGIKV